jgi:hypothetical protein
MLYWQFFLSVLRNAELSWYTNFVPDPYQNKFRGAMSSDWGLKSSNSSIRSQGNGHVGKFQLVKKLIHGGLVSTYAKTNGEDDPQELKAD